MSGPFDDLPEAGSPAPSGAPAGPFDDLPDARTAVAEKAKAKGIKLDTEAPLGGEGFTGGVIDFGRTLARGVISGIPKAAGDTAEFLFKQPEIGKTLTEFGERMDKENPQLRQSQRGQVEADDWTSLRGAAGQAGESAALSWGPGLAGAAIGAAAGAPFAGVGALPGAAAGFIVGSLGALPLFYGQQAKQSAGAIEAGLTKAREAGQNTLTDEQIKEQARTGGHAAGAIEAGGELVGDLIPFHALMKPFAGIGKAVAGGVVKSMFSPGQVAKRAAMKFGEMEAAEIGTEMAQQAGQSAVEKAFGSGGEGASWEDSAKVILPTALMTLLPGGFTTAHNFRTIANVKDALTDPTADPEQRAAAAAVVFHGIKAEDPMVAKAFDLYASHQIAGERPIRIHDDATYLDLYGKELERLAKGETAMPTPPGMRAESLGIDPNAGPISSAASAALDSGATQTATEQRTAPIEAGAAAAEAERMKAENPDLSDAEVAKKLAEAATAEEKQWAAADATAAQEEKLGKIAEAQPGWPKALFPFQTPEAAQAVAQGQSTRAGKPYVVVPHPHAHDKWAVVPKDLADEIQGAQRGAPVAAPLPPSEVKPEIKGGTNATPESGTTAVGAQPGGGQGARGQGESGGMGVGNAETPAGTGQPAAEGRPGVEPAGGEKAPEVTGGPATPPVVGGPRAPAGPVELPPIKTPVDEGAHGGAASPHTPDAEPTPAQKEAENYRTGKTKLHGWNVSVETPHGGTRSNLPTDKLAAIRDELISLDVKDNDPGARELWQALESAKGGGYQSAIDSAKAAAKAVMSEHPEVAAKINEAVNGAWAQTMQAHYGRILGTVGNDKDHVDVFIKPHTTPEHAGPIFVIDQQNPETGEFDEHKVMAGYASRFEAVKAYKAHYPKGWKGAMAVTQTTAEEFNAWAKSGQQNQPFSERAQAAAPETPAAPEPAAPETPPAAGPATPPETGGETTAGPREPAGPATPQPEPTPEPENAGEGSASPPTPEAEPTPPTGESPPTPGETTAGPAEPKAPKTPKPPGETVTITAAKKVWAEVEPTLESDEQELYANPTWRTLDGAPHIIGAEGAAYHFVRLDKQVLLKEGFVSDKARRRALGKEADNAAEDEIANMIADGDQEGLTKRIYAGLTYTPTSLDWPQIFPEDKIIRLDVATTLQAHVESQLKGMGFRITGRDMSDDKPGKITLSAIYKPEKGGITDVGGVMVGGRKDVNVSPPDPKDPVEQQIDKILASVAKGELLDAREGHGTFGSFMFREAFFDKVANPSEFIGKKFEDWSTRGKPRQAMLRAVERGTSIDTIVQLAKTYAERLNLLMETLAEPANVNDVAEALRKKYLDDQAANVNPSDGMDLAKLMSGVDLPLFITALQKTYGKDEESTDQTNRAVKKDATVPPRLEAIVRRNMKDHRGGRNIDAESEFKDVFGFRGVEFGNWVNQTERQENLNLAFDGLYDLVDTLKTEPKIVGWGSLGLAFGARGRGRASAHFEPGNNVINLTRHKGNGTVSHEWWHALEHSVRGNSNPGKELTNSLRTALQRRIDPDRLDAKVRALLRSESENPSQRNIPPKEQALNFLLGKKWLDDPYERIDEWTDYFTNAKKMDEGRSEAYWSTPHEMTARGFETFIFDTVKGGSPYLVGPTVADGYITPKNGYGGTAYPLGKERTYVAEQYRQALESLNPEDMTVKTYTTEPEIRKDVLGRFHVFDQMGMKYGQSFDEEERAKRQAEQVKGTERVFGPREAQIASAQKVAWDLQARISQIMEELGIHDYPEIKNDSMSESMFYHLRNGWWPADNNALKEFAKQAFRVDALDNLKLKQAQEDFEAALAKYAAQRITDMRLEGANDRAIYDYLVELYKKQPNLDVRTSTSMQNQGYSTPVPISLVAGLLVRAKSTEKGYDPTGGNGLLTIAANPQNMIVNELEHHRATNLRLMKFGTVHEGNALDIIERKLLRPQEVDFVLMNPPFGVLANEVLVDGYRVRAIDQLIAARNLAAMKDDGRAVIILGANRDAGVLAQKDIPFLNWLYGNYNVADHFEIDGGLYSRQGASWPIRVLVIAGRQQSDKFAPATGTVDRVSNFDELWDRYVQANARSEQVLVGSVRVPGTTGGAVGQPGGVSAGDGGQVGVPVGAGGAESGNGGGGLPRGSDQTGAKPDDLGTPASGGSPSGGATSTGQGQPGVGGARAGGRGKGSGGGAARGPVGGSPRIGGGIAGASDADIDELFGDTQEPAAKKGKGKGKAKGAAKGETTAGPAAPTKVKFTKGKAAVAEPAPYVAPAIEADEWTGTIDKILKARPFFDFMRIDPVDGQWNLDADRTLRFSFVQTQPAGTAKFVPFARGGEFLVLHGVENRSTRTYEPLNLNYQIGAKGLSGPVALVEGTHISKEADDALGELFGAKFSEGKNVDLDNTVYAKAKPKFQEVWDRLMAAIGEFRTVVTQFIRELTERFSDKIKPYLKAFVLEKRDEAIEAERAARKRAIVEPDVANDLQKVYEAGSKAPITGIYAPSGLAAEMQFAMQQLEQQYASDYPGGIDEMVQKELGYNSIEEMWHNENGEPRLGAYQIDAIALSIARMKEGLGFINGDDTGVGKGRQAAALIAWAVKNDKVPIFFTVTPDLYSDMYRDLNDIGKPVEFGITNSNVEIRDDNGTLVKEKQGDGAKTLATHIITNGALPEGMKALFTTYPQINVENDRRKAIRKLVASGKAVIIMDEAHRAAGEASDLFIELLTGNGLETHFPLPDDWSPPPTTYFSATFAKRPDNLPVYVRTDISQIGQTSDDMKMVFASGGPLLQQVVSKMLVQSGQMIRRERSYANLKIDWQVDESNAPRDTRLFDQVTEVLRSVVNADRAFLELMTQAQWKQNFIQSLIDANLMPAAATSGMKSGDIHKGLAKNPFTSVIHNYLGQLLLATKLDASVQQVVDAFNRGEKPVIALHNTMEAMLDDYATTAGLSSGDSLKDFGWKTVAKRALNNTLKIRFKNPQGFKVEINNPTAVLNLLPGHIRQEYQKAQKFIDGLRTTLTAAPIDMMRHKLNQYVVYTENGQEKMALPGDVPEGRASRPFNAQEITGRNRAVDYSSGEAVLSNKKALPKRETIIGFNGGTWDSNDKVDPVDAIILNSSGSTGISLHAGEKFRDQRPRRMFILQPSPDISVFKQTVGRINRTGQVEYPLYTVFSSAVPAEKRPLAMLRKKMKSLTSNTSAESKNATDVEATDFINEYGSIIIAQYLREHREIKDFIGEDIPSDDDSVDPELALKASGRAALLSINEQTLFYDDVERNYRAEIAERDRDGTNRLERHRYDFDAVPKSEATFVEGTDSSGLYPLRSDAILTEYEVNIIGVPPTPTEVKAAVSSSLGGVPGDPNRRTPEDVIKQIESDLTVAYDEARNQLTLKIAQYTAEAQKQDTTPKEREVLATRLAAVQADLKEFGERRERTLSALRAYSIGHGGLIRYNDVESFATVTGYTVAKPSAKAGNPFSPSNFRIQFLRNIPNGALSLQLSKIERNANFRGAAWGRHPDFDWEYRDRNLTGGREEKYIITGNIPQALSQTQGVGEIMTFTIRNRAEAETGLLMPRGFQPGDLAAQDYAMRDPRQITDFLSAVGHAIIKRNAKSYDWWQQKLKEWNDIRGENAPLAAIGTEEPYTFAVFSKNRVIALQPDTYGDIDLIIRRSEGSRWIKNKTIVGIVGDLSGRRGGSMMRATVPKDKLGQLVKFLRNQMPMYVSNSIGDLAKQYIPPAPSAKASIGEAGAGSTTAQVLGWIDPIRATWKNAPPIRVVDSIADIPGYQNSPTLSKALEGGRRVRGLFSNKGEVYLIASGLRDAAEAQFTLLHEVAGHYGLKGLLGDQLDRIMEKIYVDNPAVRAMADEKMRSRGYSRALATEEALADMAGQGEKLRSLNGFQMLVAAIRRGIRALGFDLRMSDNDVLALLAAARQVVETTGAMTIPSAGDKFSSVGLTEKATQWVTDTFLRTPNTFNPILKPFQTQYHKAQQNTYFRRVFMAAQAYIRDVAAFANDAADLAGEEMLPRLGNIADAFRNITPSRIKSIRDDTAAAANAMMLGTLADTRLTDDQLRNGATIPTQTHGIIRTPVLTESQIDLFHKARAAIDLSLRQMVTSEMAKLVKGDHIDDAVAAAKADPMRSTAILLDELNTARTEAEEAENLEAVGRYDERIDQIEKLEKGYQKLYEQGYAPLMRFGKYSVRVARTVNNQTEELFFGLYESKAAMYQAERDLREDPEFQSPEVRIVTGTMDEDQWKLYRGLSLDSLAAFANATGLSEDAAFQDFYKLALSSRSAMKRLIHRKGVAGYSEDLPRILAGFITSNARLTSRNYHFGEMTAAASEIPKELGQLRTEAARLVSYVQNPLEEAHAARGLLFVHFIGGSLASALVNLTQPFMMTTPYLSSFTNPAAAGMALARAAKAMAKGEFTPEAQAALKRAGAEGITDPQELHQLYAESIRGLGSNIWLRKGLRLWGAPFSLAETFNRRITFLAAFDIASEEGALARINAKREAEGRPTFEDAFDFAERAVEDTQGIYNRANRPNASRGAVGALVFTFKQYTIAYLEFLSRLPRREKIMAGALLLAAAGVQGAPGADNLEDLIDTIGQWLGYNTNSKRWLRQTAINYLGQVAGPMFLHGFSGIPGVPIDVSGRLGINNLIPGTNIFKQSDADKSQAVAEFAGPVGGLYSQISRGVSAAQAGNIKGMVTSASPVAVSNAMKGLDMWQTGMARDSQGRKIIDVTKFDAAVKSIGIQPKDVALASEQAQAVRQDVSMVRIVESQIADKWARGIIDRDPDAVKAAVLEMFNWNRANPDWIIRIDQRQIRQRIESAMMERGRRMVKTAPAEVRAVVARELRGE